MFAKLVQRLWRSEPQLSIDEKIQFPCMGILSLAIQYLHKESEMRSLHGFLRRSKNYSIRSGDNGEMLCLHKKSGLIFEYEDFLLRFFLPQQTNKSVSATLKAALLENDVIIEKESETLPTPSERFRSVLEANDRGFRYTISLSEGVGPQMVRSQLIESVGVSIEIQISYRKQGEKLLNDTEHFLMTNVKAQLMGATGRRNPLRTSDSDIRMMHFGELFKHATQMAIKEGHFRSLRILPASGELEREYLSFDAENSSCNITCVGCDSHETVHVLLSVICRSIFGKDVPFVEVDEAGSYFANIALGSTEGTTSDLFIRISQRQMEYEGHTDKVMVLDCRMKLSPNFKS